MKEAGRSSAGKMGEGALLPFRLHIAGYFGNGAERRSPIQGLLTLAHQQ